MRSGARRHKACEEAGISIRTLQRWTKESTLQGDRRPEAKRPEPENKLSEHEQQQILALCNRPEYASLPPSQIVPRLADKGEYVASESTIYRVLRRHGQLHYRGRAKAPARSRPPVTHRATAPNRLWSWDITYLASTVRGHFFYLYMVEDVFSRKIVGWEVHEQENGDNAAELIGRTVMAEQCLLTPLVLHADNGGPMKAHTLVAKLDDLGITPSHSRPRVSNDNAFSESLFRTLKYCPQYPSRGFAALGQARQWVQRFVHWYNEEHCHSKISFVTPGQRHRGEDRQILDRRKAVYEQARRRHPARWSGNTRNWQWVDLVTLNPEKDTCHERQAA